MKKNYLKCFFKAFGCLATLMAMSVFALLGFMMFKSTFLIPTYQAIVVGLFMVLLIGAAVVGFTGLRTPKVTMNDFVRINFTLGGIILGVFAVLNGAALPVVILFFGLAVVFIVQIGVRFTAITEDSGSVGIQAYFGSLGFRYNPIVIVAVGMALAVVVAVLNHSGAKDSIAFLKNPNLKYYVMGGILALLAVLLIFAFESDSDVSFMDFIFAVGFVAALSDLVLMANVVTITGFKYLILALGVTGVGLLIRAIFYDKDCIYDNNLHKSKTYYRNVFGKYSMLGSVIVTIVVALLAVVAVTYADGTSYLYGVTSGVVGKLPLDASLIVMVASIAICAILGVLLILLPVFRGIRATDPVKVDWVITTLILASAFAIPALIGAAVFGQFGLITANILILVALLVAVVAFVVGVALQIVRIMNFDSMAAIIAAEAKQRMDAKAEEKKAAKEEAEAKAKEEAEAKIAADPFALTEEDEALYEATYGSQEKKPEPVNTNPYADEETPVEEEVVEEEPVVEEVKPAKQAAKIEVSDDDFDAFLNSIPEKKAEKAEPAPVVEEAPVEEEVVEEEPVVEEEVVEEAPAPVAPVAEEAAEEADEDDAEEDDEDEEDEAEEINYEDEEEADEAPAEEIEHTKEADIQVQEFVAVDEEGNPKKIKRKFTAKMMFAPYETKEYYNEIKNYLMMYRAKGRNSSRCESFRYKGLVSKVALGGKAIKVFLALDPAIIEQYPKYHLKDFSEKKQYAEVPVMIKVRSERSLRYFKELVDLMFASRLVKPKKNYEPQNFMPSLIPNGEAILGNLGMASYYLQDSMNINGIPEEMPEDLIEYLPMIPGEPLEEEEEDAVAYVDTLCQHFNEGDEITLDVLKSMHICQKGNVLRIKARGTVDRKLIIYAEKFDADALAMIMCTNGTAIRIVR